MRRLLRVLLWVVALAALHFVSLVPLPFTRGNPGQTLQHLSPDLVALLALALLGAAIGRGRLFAHLAAIVLLVSVLHRTASVFVAMMLERKLDLTSDLMQLPAVLHLVTQDGAVPPWLVAVGAALALLVIELLLAAAFRRVARPGVSPRGVVWMAACLQGLVLADVVRSSCDRSAASSWHRSAALALARDVGDTIRYWWNPDAIDGPIRARIEAGAKVMAATPTDLERLGGADVHVLVVESYGRHALREPMLAARLQALWPQLHSELDAAGFRVWSSACQPSNSGGGSWLTHAQLLSAVRIGDQRSFRMLLASDLQPLPKRFQAAGYRTVEVMPGMPHDWPEGERFYGFDQAITQVELDYHGTVYHWGRMPDQFALHHLLEHVVRPAPPQPLFTMFVSVTSHVPFRLVPPYITDWQIDGDTFRRPPQIEHRLSWLDVPYSPLLLQAYGDTIEYSLRTAVGFAARLTRPSLVIVLGDHQSPIAGVGAHPDTSRDVPIHILSNRPELLARLGALGFVEGFAVPEQVVAFDTAEFAPVLLRTYSR